VVVKGVADQFGGGREVQLVQETGSIGAHGLDAESQKLRNVFNRPALG
jgi:hypothetical protein